MAYRTCKRCYKLYEDILDYFKTGYCSSCEEERREERTLAQKKSLLRYKRVCPECKGRRTIVADGYTHDCPVCQEGLVPDSSKWKSFLPADHGDILDVPLTRQEESVLVRDDELTQSIQFLRKIQEESNRKIKQDFFDKNMFHLEPAQKKPKKHPGPIIPLNLFFG